MRQINVYLKGNTWMADFVNDARIKNGFGTTALPTPYTAQTPGYIVAAEIRRLNPEDVVTLL